MATKVRRGTKGEVIQARIATTTKHWLDSYAETQDTTSSELVRRLIEEYKRVIEHKTQRENHLHISSQLSYNDASESASIGSR